MNLKLLNNFALFIKLNKVEEFLKNNNIKQFLIIKDREYENLWNKLNENNNIYGNFYLVFDISSNIQKEEIQKMIKFIAFLKKIRKNFIFIVPNKSLINLFDYVIIEENFKNETPFLKEAITNFFQRKGIFKNFSTGPFDIKNINSTVLFKNNKIKYYELYYIEGLYLYAIKNENYYILMNVENIKELFKFLFKEHPIINKSLYLLFNNKQISILLKELDKKYINNVYSYFYNIVKISEKLLDIEENKDITPKNVCKNDYFYKIITMLLNKFNVNLKDNELTEIPYLRYIKVK